MSGTNPKWNVASALEAKYNPWPGNWLLKGLAALWSFPYGVIGFLGILVAILTNHAVWINPSDGGIDVVVQGWYAKKKASQGWGAVTLGWCMFYWEADAYLNSIRVHERVHIKQALRLGLLMPLTYLILSRLKGYRDNPFEIEAYNVEEEYVRTHSDN